MDNATAQLVAKSVREYLQKQPNQNVEDATTLKLAIMAGGVPDYERDSLAFAAAYWERNFWKAVYFFCYEYVRPSMLANPLLLPGKSVDVVVLGAGSAADTVACLLWLDCELPLQKVTVTLVDQSRSQLALARSVIERAKASLGQADFDIRYLNVDASDWNPGANSADLILMGHFLTENPDDKEALVAKTVAALKPRGDLLIIERQRDPVWRWARQRLALCGVTTHDVDISDEKFKLLAPWLPATEADITPLYVRGNVPANKRLMELVRDYFGCWSQHSSDALCDVFAPNATYDEKPGVEPLIVGLDGIRRYWDENPGQQRDTRLVVHNVAYSDTVAVCSWSGEFDTPEQHVAIRGAMNFYLDPYFGKINRFDELFGTVKTPL